MGAKGMDPGWSGSSWVARAALACCLAASAACLPLAQAGAGGPEAEAPTTASESQLYASSTRAVEASAVNAPAGRERGSTAPEPTVADAALDPLPDDAQTPAGEHDGTTPPASSDTEPDEPAPHGDLRVDRGPERLALLVPRGEELAFEVEIDLGVLGEPTVGKVTLSSGAEPYIEGLPSRGAKRSGKEVGWIRSTAQGDHMGYVLDHELYVRHLPQSMPHVLLTDTQKGSENRRRKLKIGVVEDKLVCTYEHDGHCKGCNNQEHFVESKWVWGKPYHCEKCKKMEHRLWKEPLTREIPPGSLDMLSAVYLARTMVREGVDAVTFPLIDKQKLWEVDLKRGKKTRTIEVPAGRFNCTQVQLLTRVPAGEPKDGEGFQGLFGIQGTIQIWFETSTGVPVLISGTLPVPVLGDLDVRVELAKYKGTPESFKPLR